MGESAIQTLVEFSTGECRKLGTFEKEIKLFFQIFKAAAFLFFHWCLNAVVIDLFLKIK